MSEATAPLWSAHDLVEATGGRLSARFAATGVSIDTRTLQPGDLFIALRGETGDGHAHAAAALARGAAGVMVHQPVAGDGPWLAVDDTLSALARLGAYARERFTGRLIAVTGSVGKTTTKEMLRTVLAAQAPTHAAAASYNNHWGLPLTLARLPWNAAFCVAEIGMNHAGEIAPLARLARPHVAVITAIAPAHIGYLGSIEAIAAEKASICQGLEPAGTAVLPADTPLLPLLRQAAEPARVVTFGEARTADARLLAAVPDADGSDVEVNVLGQELRFRLAAPGRHMAMNALAALAGAAALGADLPAAARSLAGFAPMAGRGARRRLALAGGSVLLLDESYNANPASLRAALNVLRLQPAARRIAVLGDMLELGEAGPALHAALAPDVLDAADLVFACGKLMRGLFDALPVARRGSYAEDAAALAPLVAAALRPGDAVLVKGSLGIRMRQIVVGLDGLAVTAGAA
ncbi:MAG TPA: UDP-N-acetylmuramoyl-tripeptide--D-alanyl-D-alanine ligase [Candidatus Sulfotelmatobacter sp.]|nr:UDP-N-acetylmuramoyl-tripeptide--D-alanyl-D-alanine ligase [Candidatus Sulfotelmatobacter sp.]